MKTLIVPPAAPKPVKLNKLNPGECYSNLPRADNIYMVIQNTHVTVASVVELGTGRCFNAELNLEVHRREATLHVEALLPAK